MALSRIWASFIIIAFLTATVQFFTSSNGEDIYSRMFVGKNGDTSKSILLDSTKVPVIAINKIRNTKEVVIENVHYSRNSEGKFITYYQQNADGIIATCKSAVDLSINLVGIMALFMGFMSIAEKAGGVRLISKLIAPFFSKLFPGIPKGHPAFGHMMLNFSANLLNLDNAATPFGLKAMQSLQELNPNKEIASNAQIMFLCLHASGLTFIPTSIIAIRASLHASNPTDIFIPCLIATFVATLAAMCIISYKQKINIFQPVILIWILSISTLIALMVLYLRTLSYQGIQSFSSVLSNGLILLILFLIVLGALYKNINVFEAFVNGAKDGFETAVRIIPYLVGMLVAISLLRTSGTFDFVISGMKHFFSIIFRDTRFVDGLPTALIRPLSGGGSRGMMIDTIKTFGADSFAGRLSSVLQSASDTTFYVVAVFFGSVSIKNTRYAIGSMLLADLVGAITSIILCYLFFG